MPRRSGDNLPRFLRGRPSCHGNGGRSRVGQAGPSPKQEPPGHEERIQKEAERVQAELRRLGLDPALQDGMRAKIARANRRPAADERGGACLS